MDFRKIAFGGQTDRESYPDAYGYSYSHGHDTYDERTKSFSYDGLGRIPAPEDSRGD